MADYDTQRGIDKITRLLSLGDAAAAAEKHAQRFTTHYPDIAQGWFLLGVSKHLQRKHAEALPAFDKAISIVPNHIQAWRAKAAVLSEQERMDEALQACEKTLQLNPNDSDLITNLATVLQKLGRHEEALERFDLALTHQPNHFFALLNRGALLLRLQRFEDAIVTNKQFVALHPTVPEAYFNLSENLFALFRHEEALAICEAGLAIAPQHAGLHLNRGVALAVLKRFEESGKALELSFRLDPGLLSRLIPNLEKIGLISGPMISGELVYLEVHTEALQCCHWQSRIRFYTTLSQFIADEAKTSLAPHNRRLAFTLLGLPVTPEQHLYVLKQISAAVQNRVLSYCIPPFSHHGPKTKIRIGYVSPDFKSHATAYLIKDLFPLHDRQKFEIYCYSLIREDEDPIQKEIAANCDCWRDLSESNDTEAAQQIHRDEIDILVDLAGYTAQSRPEIFALRPAPVQVNFLGYPGTMGAPFMDYLIGDPIVTPLEHAHHFAERLALMPHSYQPNSRPQYLPEPPSRSACKLPDNAFVFCGFNQAFKITPEIFDIWMKLLYEVPGSVLWLLESSPIATRNLQREARSRGIDEQRLIFAPRVPWLEHLARQRHADLLLDTFPCNAHTTASDALWAGVPLVTRIGETFPSRVAASLLHAVGLPELITSSLTEYEQLAKHLATNPKRLMEIRQRLIASRASAPLFDQKRFVSDLEALFETMLQEHETFLN